MLASQPFLTTPGGDWAGRWNFGLPPNAPLLIVCPGQLPHTLRYCLKHTHTHIAKLLHCIQWETNSDAHLPVRSRRSRAVPPNYQCPEPSICLFLQQKGNLTECSLRVIDMPSRITFSKMEIEPVGQTTDNNSWEPAQNWPRGSHFRGQSISSSPLHHALSDKSTLSRLR